MTCRAAGWTTWLWQGGGCEEGRDSGAHTVGNMGHLGVGGTVSPYQRRRRPEKLSLRRDILDNGQVPMGMKVSRYLLGRGSSEGHASLLRSPVALLLIRRKSPRDTCAGWESHQPPSLREALGKVLFNPAPVGPTWSAGGGAVPDCREPIQDQP